MRHTPQQKNEPGPRWRRRLRRAGVTAGGVLAVGIAVAGCGGGSSTPGVATVSTTTTTAASPSVAGGTQATGLLAYASCMRSHGVPNFPDPSFRNGQVEFPMLEHLVDIHSTQSTHAYQTCRKLIPGGLPDSGSGS
jgi:hypothetical protein